MAVINARVERVKVRVQMGHKGHVCTTTARYHVHTESTVHRTRHVYYINAPA